MGFGGLLLLLAFIGLDAIIVLGKIQAENEPIHAIYIHRKSFTALLAFTFIGGVVLAAGSFRRILYLEHMSEVRFEEVMRARAALSDLSARLVEMQETERRALSRELHDEVGQTISALTLAIGNLGAAISSQADAEAREQLQDIRALAQKTIAAVRDITLLLRPSMLDDLGLGPALQWQAREISRTTNLPVEIRVGLLSDDLPDDHKTCIYRVVQEALRNAARHAKAKKVDVCLEQTDETLRLTIQDDGKGFLPEKARGLGLLGMQERITHLNGSFHIDSRPGCGTVIHIELPQAM